MDLVSIEEFDNLYDSFETTVWRWEAQAAYNEPEEAEPYARWKAGQPDDYVWCAAWLEQLRAATTAGKQFARVRVLHDPLTDYQRWGLTIAPGNVAAGEEIRVLGDDQAHAHGLPDYDFLMVDDRLVARMIFTDNRFVGAEVTTDPGTVARHRAWQDLAQQHSIPINEYQPRSP